MQLTSVEIAAVAGVLLSLVFQYIPGLSAWYDALTPTPKRLVMLAALAVSAVGVLAYQCRGDGACYGANWETAVKALVTAVVANQGTASILPLSPERRQVRDEATERNEPAKAVAP